MEKRNLLVLENFDYLDTDLNHWITRFVELNKGLKIDYTVEKLLDLKNEDKSLVLEKISKADDVVVKSTFGAGSLEPDGFNQFIKFAQFFLRLGVPKRIYILKSNGLLDFLNNTLDTEHRDLIINVINRCVVFEVYSNEYQKKGAREKMIMSDSDFHFEFDECIIKYYSDHDIFHTEKPKHVPHPNDWLCEPVKKKTKSKKILSKSDQSFFQEVLEDSIYMLSNKIEDIEHGIYNSFDSEKEKQDILDSHKKKLEVINKVLNKRI